MLEDVGHCRSAWWTNLLYINNFVPKVYTDQCVPWAWYLANDMQFFVIGMLILALYRKTKVRQEGVERCNKRENLGDKGTRERMEGRKQDEAEMKDCVKVGSI